jgi:tetratricopeptide (TPR) repeat protein
LTPRERLELFIPVCQAVQHAHTKGIIHRDIKPSNVLVTVQDGKAVPKVIDFGVAKATAQGSEERTAFTDLRQFIGTPEYMSPEQAGMGDRADGGGVDIDTRSDVYSLGVLLYELLVGTTPLDAKQLRSAAFAEMQRIIREVDPPKPSTRLSTLETLASVAACRQVEPRRMGALVRGDLDWIVMKCLEKDRARRYETANGLAADVQRHLNGEAVVAAPPSRAYRIRKFVRKHRAGLATATALAVLLLAGAGVSTWQAVRATRAETHSRERLTQLEKSDGILTSIFADLDIRAVKQGSEPLEAVLAKRLVKAGEQLKGEAVGDPVVVADLQDRLGQSLLNLGYPDDAVLLLTKARQTLTSRLGADHPDTLLCTRTLAATYLEVDKLDLALPLLEENLRLTRAKLGADHPDTFLAMNNLADGYRSAGKMDVALPLVEEALKLARAKLPVDDPEVLLLMNNLAASYASAGKLSMALPLLEDNFRLTTAKLGVDHPQTLASRQNLGDCYENAGLLDRALPLLEENYRLARGRLGIDHPDTLRSMRDLASCYKSAGKLDQALALWEEYLRLARGKLGTDHPVVAAALNHLGLFLVDLGRLPEAEDKFREAAATNERLYSGSDNENTANVLSNLARVLERMGRAADAERVLRDTLAMRQRLFKGDNHDVGLTMDRLGELLRARGALDEAEPFIRGALAMAQRLFPGDHPDVVAGLNRLALLLGDRGEYEAAERCYRDALAMHLRLSKKHDVEEAVILRNLGLTTLARGHFKEAETVLKQALEIQRRLLPPTSPDLAQTMSAFGYSLLGQATAAAGAEAEPILHDCLQIRRKLFPDGHPRQWITYNTMSMLGESLVLQGKCADAEPLLLDAYRALKDDPRVPPPAPPLRINVQLRLLGNIVHLYEAWHKAEPGKGYDAKAAEWRAKLDASTPAPIPAPEPGK